MKTRKQEKGALLVEVIAVLGLIALMTPILFDQIQKRNEEIINTQIASEMRALKDALSNYIQANEAWLADGCGLMDGGEYIADAPEEPCGKLEWLKGNECKDGAACDDGENISACSMCAGAAKYFADSATAAQTVFSEYKVVFYGKTVPSGNSGYRPVIYAVAYQATPPSTQNLRRASKAAALIGVEGGVVIDRKINGMQGVWEKSGIDGTDNAIAVTTSFDSVTNSAILKDATFSNMQASGSVQAPTIATESLGVLELFTVSADEANCILDYNSDAVTISGADADCAPVFSVDAGTREVTMKGVIKTTKPTGATTCTTETTKQRCEQIPNCVWVAKSEDEGECVGEYLLNPAGTSMMEDIKLASRGGANLSDILPKWSLQEVDVVGNTNVTMKGCPVGYKNAIIVLPANIKRDGTGNFTVTVKNLGSKITTPNSEEVSVTISGLQANERVAVHKYCVYEP